MEPLARPAFLPLALILCFGITPVVMHAQENSPAAQTAVATHRPRIGLALSGGGAYGLAEIGVIRWMEENHIPVDRIAGTSMGSIIGAMYATGMSPAEIQTFAEKIDWEKAFLPGPVYTQISYRRKQDRRDFLINTPLGFKHGLRGPNGYNSGQGVGLLLDRIAFPESSIASFDDLPIPFRCVATDMMSGEGVVLRDGPLAQALRASMALPGVFTPVEINGRLLADGGMVQNIPVETVLAMDADAVIAVELQLPPGDRKELETLTGVLSRAVDVMITRNEHDSLALAKAKVSIAMKGFAETDYDRVSELVALGYRSTAAQSAALLPYAIHDPAEWQQYLQARHRCRRRRQPEKIEAIEVTGADSDTDRRIRRQLLTKTQNQPIFSQKPVEVPVVKIDKETGFLFEICKNTLKFLNHFQPRFLPIITSFHNIK